MTAGASSMARRKDKKNDFVRQAGFPKKSHFSKK
jgi:hypothetical protein